MKSRIYGTSLLFLILFLLLTVSSGFCADNAGTQAKGTLSIENGVTRTEYRNNDVDLSLRTYLYYGVAKNMEAQLALPLGYQIIRNGAKTWIPGDATVTLKYRFLDEKKNCPGMALKLHATIDRDTAPSARYYLGSEGINLAVSKHLDKNTEARLETGYQFDNNRNGNSIFYETGVSHNFNKTFTLGGYVGGSSPDNGQTAFHGKVSGSINFSKALTLNLNYAAGLNDAAPRNSMGASVQVNF